MTLATLYIFCNSSKSGLTLISILSVATVINPSPMPITAWIPAMADKTIFNGAVPEMLNSTAQQVADNTREHHAAVKLPIKRPFLP